jgi:hypothetical protein
MAKPSAPKKTKPLSKSEILKAIVEAEQTAAAL